MPYTKLRFKSIHLFCQSRIYIHFMSYLKRRKVGSHSPYDRFYIGPVNVFVNNIFKRFYCDKIDYSCRNKTFLNNYVKEVRDMDVSDNSVEAYLTQNEHFTKCNSEKVADLFLDSPEESDSMTAEKIILNYLQKWELEKTCELLKSMINNEIIPDRQVILRLLEHLSFLGKVEEIHELNDLLQKYKLITNLDFLRCIHYAYCHSGRIVDGITMLKSIYSEDKKQSDADIFFNLMATKVIIHFPHRMNLIMNFVEEIEKQQPSNQTIRASLWCCYVQAEKFSKADVMLKEHENLKKIVPAQVTKLVQCHQSLDFNIDHVFVWILQQPYIKQGLKSSALDVLLLYNCKLQEWNKVFYYLSFAKEHDIKLHQQTLQFFLHKFLSEFSEARIEDLLLWAGCA